MKGMLIISADRCLGCRSCELACAVEHSQSKDLIKAIDEDLLPQYRVEVEMMEDLTVPLQCRHCEDAPCVAICPTHALEKVSPDSPVSLKEDLCIGCKWCIMVCPFGVIKLRRDGKAVVKCDLCQERRERGKQPACVEACPTGALEFIEIEKITKQKRKEFLVSLVKSEKEAERVRKK
ncbi:MAG TPA: 4Fe-4S dicluster domain-containing protein [Candidatus Aerophobetes bacterium]|uniref:4Fe-4S dicluster domain-containing protein n=1 Tax=Aerophobetes bacterium TaxID=2030807 RepID=A0A7V0MYU4_UNCAE|nr:4Fe-4S dicluster domain-containing protein [Candidatus Aerophobetes bacterium]